MSGQDVVARFLDALVRRDVDGAMSSVADDVRVSIAPLHVQGASSAALRTVLDDLVTAFPDLLITVQRTIATGDVVTVQLKVEGTQAAPYAGAINQEKHLDLDQAWRFTVAGDAVVAIDAYWCQQQLYRRLAVKRLDQLAIA
jgi:ketosteroid isomerase-like protein